MIDLRFKLIFILLVLCGIKTQAQLSWTQMQDAPDNRYEGVSFAAGDKVYYGLGLNVSLGYADNKFYRFDPVTNSWDTIAPFPGVPRRLASAFSVAGKGYVCFGVDPATTLQLSDLWEYDPSQNTWMQKAGLPGANGWLAGTATATAAKGYAGLGLHDHTSGFLNLTWWEYDPSANQWFQKADMPGVGLYQSASFTVGDSIYIVCGMGSSLLVPTREVWLFDIQANSWTQLPDFPGSARTSVSAFTIADTGYAGYGLGNGAQDLFNDFYAYNSQAGTWTQKPFCATALFDAACATSAAGYVINNKSWNSSSPDVWEFGNGTTGIYDKGNDGILFTACPNPSDGFLNVYPGNFTALSFYSIESKLVATYLLTPGKLNRVDCSSLAGGAYYLEASNGRTSVRKKIFITQY
jgi:N-acetylneuraminic acid mutarotase